MAGYLHHTALQDTYTTLHLWTQIVGKIRLALMPTINHWWQSTLYVTPRGLTTGTIPYKTRTEAFYSSELQEFILPYEVVRQAGEPDAVLLAFLQSTYEAAANLGHWDRIALERTPTV